ncbi:MAG: SPASM domain-containing protein [Planctomycetaceae bacterium]|nr:SPASM domain-containing protein [Planctomycetales bacterium]MCB9921494.1 SPASM domain-containing protein [Planctomycetaceae bacterium]
MSSHRIVGYVVGKTMEVMRKAFPKTVRVETTNHCNASCTFCPRDTIGREKTFMSEELYEKIIDECVEGKCKTVHLHNFGEPLLDKRLPQWVRLAKDRGIPKVKIFTNGSLLSGKMAEGLIDSGLDELKVSIDGVDAKEFDLLRVGLKHSVVMKNVREFRQLRDERGSGPTIIAACCQTSNRNETTQMLDGVVDKIDFATLHNWAGARGILPANVSIRKPCDRLWRTFTILVNGDVALCCLDHSGKEIIGNCQQERIVDIWSNEKYRQLRQLHMQSRQGEMSLCNGCSKAFLVGAANAAA